jgi:hypothetical protein
MAKISPFLYISLNVSGLNSPNKRHILITMNKKNEPTTCHLKLNYLRSKDTSKLEKYFSYK